VSGKDLSGSEGEEDANVNLSFFTSANPVNYKEAMENDN